jgi:hypothetical protein
MPTHEIDHYGTVTLVDEGVEDGSSGAYLEGEEGWPRIRRTAEGRWLDYHMPADPVDITHNVREL